MYSNALKHLTLHMMTPCIYLLLPVVASIYIQLNVISFIFYL